MIIGLGESQWKLTIAHVLPEILNRVGKLRLLASQNIDGLDHRVVSDKTKLYNPHGLMSVLVSEPYDEPLCTSPSDPIYQRYVELVKANIKDIYSDRPARRGKSSHLWPGPDVSTPITLDMLGDLLPQKFHKAREQEIASGTYSLKPGTVLFDRTLWGSNAAGQPCNAFEVVRDCDCVLIMGTSLSGLTIDNIAHAAGRDIDIPLIVCDMTSTPVESLKAQGSWRAKRDCHMQGPLDETILKLLHTLGWFDQLFDFLPHLCLGSLKTLRHFVANHISAADTSADYTNLLDAAIRDEICREERFYGNE